jgi:Domain of unknown function (DUF4190)
MMSARAAEIFHGVGATALAVAMLFVGAAAPAAYDLPFINGWALMHGSIFVVFPAYFVLSYFFLLPIARRLQSVDPVPVHRIPVLAIVSLLLSGSGIFILFVGPVLGITTGHLALLRYKNNSQATGVGIAVVGLVLGYLLLAYEIYVAYRVSSVAMRLDN